MITSLAELLVCPCLSGGVFFVAVVRRRGRDCELLRLLTGLNAAISTSDDGLQAISEAFNNLPTRVLDGEEGALLAAKTILAAEEGLRNYRL